MSIPSSVVAPGFVPLGRPLGSIDIPSFVAELCAPRGSNRPRTKLRRPSKNIVKAPRSSRTRAGPPSGAALAEAAGRRIAAARTRARRRGLREDMKGSPSKGDLYRLQCRRKPPLKKKSPGSGKTGQTSARKRPRRSAGLRYNPSPQRQEGANVGHNPFGAFLEGRGSQQAGLPSLQGRRELPAGLHGRVGRPRPAPGQGVAGARAPARRPRRPDVRK